MKILLSAALMVCCLGGCVSESGEYNKSLVHADSIAAIPTDQGPTLCRDGTAPPCTVRD